MKKITLSVEQMKHLQELGLDTTNASMYYNPHLLGWLHRPQLTDFDLNDAITEDGADYVPAYTLQDIIDALPNTITIGSVEHYLTIWKESVGYQPFDTPVVGFPEISSNSLIDDAYKMLCWVIENKYINI